MSGQPHKIEVVFYIDESIYSKTLVGALETANIPHRRVGMHLPFGSPDHEWLKYCGDNQLIAITRDQRIRYRALEKLALVEYGVGAFTFAAGQATSDTTAKRVFELMPRMINISKSEGRPFLYTFSVHNDLARVALKRGVDNVSKGTR